MLIVYSEFVHEPPPLHLVLLDEPPHAHQLRPENILGEPNVDDQDDYIGLGGHENLDEAGHRFLDLYVDDEHEFEPEEDQHVHSLCARSGRLYQGDALEFLPAHDVVVDLDVGEAFIYCFSLHSILFKLPY